MHKWSPAFFLLVLLTACGVKEPDTPAWISLEDLKAKSIPYGKVQLKDGKYHRPQTKAPYSGWVQSGNNFLRLKSGVPIEMRRWKWKSPNKILLVQPDPNLSKYFPYSDLNLWASIYYGTNQEHDFHGTYTSWHPLGTKEEEFQFTNSRIHGIKRQWYLDGQIKSLWNFREGQIEGVQQSWHANGEKAAEGHWEKSKQIGPYRKWHPNGQLAYETHFEEGQNIRTITQWHDNGVKASKATIVPEINTNTPPLLEFEFAENRVPNWRNQGILYKDDDSGIPRIIWSQIGVKEADIKNASWRNKYHGVFRVWDKKGNLVSEFNYKDGVLNGKADYVVEWESVSNCVRSYAPERRIENYVDGKKHGLQNYLRLDGGTKRIENYHHGEKHGKEMRWAENGMLLYSGNFQNGKQHGHYELWHENGALKETGVVVNGKHVKYSK